MGYVIRGKIGFRSGRQRGAVRGGRRLLRRPGTHAHPVPGTEVVEVSRSEELGRTMEVVTKNMEEMEASA
jgi:hypothetical protein